MVTANSSSVSLVRGCQSVDRNPPGLTRGAVDGGLVDSQLIPGKRNWIGAVWKVSYLLPHVEHHCFILVIDLNVNRIPITWNFPAFDFLVIGIKCNDNQNKIIRYRSIRPIRIITRLDNDICLANRKSSWLQNLSRSGDQFIAIPDLFPTE